MNLCWAALKDVVGHMWPGERRLDKLAVTIIQSVILDWMTLLAAKTCKHSSKELYIPEHSLFFKGCEEKKWYYVLNIDILLKGYFLCIN